MAVLFQGCATALATPFLPDGTLDEPALRRLIAIQMDANMDALVLLGTTGEPCTLTMAERERVITIGLDAVHGTMPVIVGTGANDTRQALQYAKQAKLLGAQGQLCVTPYYNKTTQTGLLRHYETILDSCELPMLLYNVPSRTGMTISADTACVLAAHPLVAGLKEASGNLAQAAELIERTGGHLSLYGGNDDQILPLLAMGAVGIISVCANVAPQHTRALTMACLNGDFVRARVLQGELMPLIRALFAQVSPIPLKAALSMMGLCCDVLRLPLTPLEEPYRAQLKACLQASACHTE